MFDWRQLRALGNRRGAPARGQRRPLPREDPLVRAPGKGPGRDRRAPRAGAAHRRRSSSSGAAGSRRRPTSWRPSGATARSPTSRTTGSTGGAPTAPSPTSRPPAGARPGTRRRSSSGGRPLLDEIVVEEDRPRWKAHAERGPGAAGAARGSSSASARRTGRCAGSTTSARRSRARTGRTSGVRGSNRDVTEKKLSEEQLRSALAEIQRLRERLEADNTYLREQVEPEPGFEGIIGAQRRRCATSSRASSRWRPPRARSCSRARPASARSSSPTRIHNLSPRRDRPARQAQLRGAAALARRERALRAREGRLHRRRRPAQGPLRDRRRRHPLPRRDRRAAPRAAGQAPARDPGRGVRARRRHHRR